MPPSLVPRRVEDIIFYYYSKLVIARSAGFDGNYGFIIGKYRQLKAGSIRLSDYDHELEKLAEQTEFCSYCQKRDRNLMPSEIVPRQRGGPIGVHNLVLACRACYHSKGTLDLIEWWLASGRDLDKIPRIPIGLYLKLAYEAHQINFTLGVRCNDLTDLFPSARPRRAANTGS